MMPPKTARECLELAAAYMLLAQAEQHLYDLAVRLGYAHTGERLKRVEQHEESASVWLQCARNKIQRDATSDPASDTTYNLLKNIILKRSNN